MKQRILAVLLCLAMLFSLLPMGAVAEEAPEQQIAEKPHVHEDHEGWTAWGDDAGEKGTLPGVSGQYYLTEDLSVSTAPSVASAEQIVLCLNGKTVDCTTSKRAYRLCKGAELTICDCTAATDDQGVYTAGKITGATNTAIMIGQETPGAVLTVCDGIFEKNTISSSGAVVVAQGGSQVHVYGGLFRENGATKNGGVIYANNTTVNLYGGEFADNTAGSAGAAIYASSAALNLLGGRLTGGTAAHGGGVYIQNASATMLAGVQIVDNTATVRGAGVDYLGASTLTVGGDTVITGNKVGESDNNLVLVNGRKLQLDETKPLIPGADIGISVCTWSTFADYTLSGNVSFGTNATQEDAASYFHSDVTGTEHFVQVKNGNLRFALPKKEHPVEENHPENIQWTSWTESSTLPNTTGYYVLENDVDVTVTNGVAVNTEQQIVLCLNGYSVTGKTRIYRLSKGADVTICDCTAYYNEDGDLVTGKLVPGTSDGGVAALVADGADATVTTLTLRNIIIDGGGRTNANGGALQLGATGSTVNVEDCIIQNCTSTSKGGAIHVANGTLNIRGSVITGNKAAYGGALMVQKTGKVTLTDTVITGNTATARAGGVDLEITVGGTGFVKVNGNTVIEDNTNTKSKCESNVNLLNATRQLTVGELGGKASIGISVENSAGNQDLGAATVCAAAPARADKYFTSDAGHDMILDGAVLKVQPRVHADHETDECGHENVTWTGVTAMPTESGHYYLSGNVTVTSTTGFAYNTGEEITICLNGYQIKGSGGRLFRMSNDTKLSICDCTGHGKLTGGSNAVGGVAWIGKDASDSAGGSLTIYGGTVTGNTTGDASALFAIPNGSFHLAGGAISGGTYRAVLLQNGSFTMSGGKIENITYDAQDGAAVRVTNGTFTMTGGEITGITKTKNGGVVRIDKGTSTLSGGKITGNTTPSASGLLVAGGTVILEGVEISNNTTAGAGGGVYALNDAQVQVKAGTVIRDNVSTGTSGGGGMFITGNAAVLIDDAVITGNTAAELGGGVMHKSTGTLTIQGATRITGNKTGKLDSNLYLYGTEATLGQLTEGASIGITGDLGKMFTENGLVIANNAAQKNIVSFFTSDQEQILEQKDGKLWLIPDPTRLHTDHATDACGHKDVAWTVWADATTLPTAEGHYYLMSNVTLGETIGVVFNNGAEVTICLNGFTVTGNGTGRIFRVSNGSKVNVCDCTGSGQLTNCNNTKAGVAWIGKDASDAEGGSLTVYGGTVTGNTAGDAGALFYVEGGSFTMAGGTVTENDCRIIYLSSGDVTVSGGTITKNTFGRKDGSVLRMANGAFTMTGGEISNNDNGRSGGILRMDKGVANITGGQITGNTASGGPALLLNGAEVTLSNVEISGNTSVASGGAAYLMNGSKLIIKSGTVIKNNKAQKWGGGIYAADSTLKIEGGLITGNYSEVEGGGVYMSNGDFTMSGGSISYNTTNQNGGAVCVRGEKGVFYLYGGTIAYNNALNTKSGTGHCGGVLAQGKGSFYMYGGLIQGNRSYQMGGGVRIAANSGFGLYGGTITENHSYRGGGVYTDSPCVIENVKIINNTADYEGGGFYSSGCKVTMNSGIIQGNSIIDKDNDGKPEGSAGGVCSRASSVFIMNGGEILDNVAKHGGGMVVQSGSQLIMNGGVFAGNRAHVGYGGALYNSNCTVEILGGEFRENFSSGSAGAIYNDGTITIKNTYFTGNHVSTDKGGIVSGGAVKSVQNRLMTMENCKFEKNTIMGRAGAVDLGYKSTTYMTGCEFVNNTASTNGGAVSLYTVTTLYMTDCTFTGNTAVGMGGAFYSEPVSKLFAEGCTFENNKGNSGGALYVNTVTQATLTDCTFTGNTGSRGGSAIYAKGGISLTDCTITGGQGKAHAVTITGEGNDGESFIVGVNQLKGNVIIEGEQGGMELLSGAFVNVHGDGLGEQAKILVTRSEGGLTKAIFGGYDYIRQGDVYTVTKGELSLKQADPVTVQEEEEEVPATDPTETTEPVVSEGEAKQTVLIIFGIILAVAAALTVAAVLAVRKMKKRIAAQENQ